MKFKEIEVKNQVSATNHKHITRESRHCSPTSRICLKNEDEWNPRCRKSQIPNYVLPVRIQGDPSSPRCVEREYDLGSWRGWVGRESFELEVCKNGGEERGRGSQSVEERGRVRYFCFCKFAPHTTYYNPLITPHTQMSLVYIVCDHNTYFHKPNLSKDYNFEFSL